MYNTKTLKIKYKFFKMMWYNIIYLRVEPTSPMGR